VTNPFDAVIKTLEAERERYFLPEELPERKQIEAAIRVLEAAGEMSKERHLTHFIEETSHVKCYYCTAIHALLAALPDKEKP